MNKFGVLLSAAVLFFSFTAKSQLWVDLMQSDTANFYDVQAAFNSYWSGKTIEKGKGWKAFKRWEWFNEQRRFPTGNPVPKDITARNYKSFLDTYLPTRATNGNWTSLGPGTIPAGGGAGRVNCVRFDPSNPNIIFAGTPAGGIWKSTDAGATWANLNSDKLESMGVYDIAIDPVNPNNIYIATGDMDGSDTYSVGILKSTDGGLTWNPTGLSYATSQYKLIARLIIDPTNPNILYAAGNAGVFKSTDAGINWTNVLVGNFRDMEMKPGDPNTLYVCGTIFKYTNDGGATWNATIGSLSLMNRMTIAVTPANPAYVYLLASNSGDNGFQALLRSTDSGLSFTTMADRTSDPNILGWNFSGSDAGGQGWYDLALAVSPTNANTIITGGVNIWKSTNGGSSFTCTGHWTGSSTADYVHADIHDLQFAPGSGTVCYAGCDGGVFKSTNTATDWFDQTNNLGSIAQMYRLGVSQTNAARVITGWQDNGTNFLDAGAWEEVLGGDGMECIISHSSSSTVYGSLYYGEIHKSTNAGATFSNIVNSGGTGVDEDGAWVTPYIMWEGNANYLYVGKKQVYRSTNAGTSFTQVGTLPTGSLLAELAVAPSSTNYIYAARTNQLYVTIDGGTTWINRSAGLPSANISYVTVSNVNPSKAWVTFSGYDAGEKIYETTDAGVTWTNISYNLPNIPANCVEFMNGSADGLYVGMDIGVYYKDGTMTNWILFNQGLPNTVVTELEIQYSTSKLRAATYGRGLWESGLYSAPTSAPVAAFSTFSNTVCVGNPVEFTDLSTNLPTSWSWNFGGGSTPATSTDQFPTVVFNTPGTYSITLDATNGFGTGTTTITNMITVLPEITNNIISEDQLYCGSSVADTIMGTVPAGGYGSYTYNWMRSFASATTGYVLLTTQTGLNYYPSTVNQDMWIKRVANSGTCKDTADVVFIDIVTVPIPMVTLVGGNTLTTPDNGYSYQWYEGGVLIPGATDTFLVVTTTASYTVIATDTNGCFRSSANYNFVSVDEPSAANEFTFWPNPANDKLNIQFNLQGNHQITLVNSLSQNVYKGVYNGSGTHTIPVAEMAKGVYFLKIDSGNGVKTHKVIIANR